MTCIIRSNATTTKYDDHVVRLTTDRGGGVTTAVRRHALAEVTRDDAVTVAVAQLVAQDDAFQRLLAMIPRADHVILVVHVTEPRRHHRRQVPPVTATTATPIAIRSSVTIPLSARHRLTSSSSSSSFSITARVMMTRGFRRSTATPGVSGVEGSVVIIMINNTIIDMTLNIIVITVTSGNNTHVTLTNTIVTTTTVDIHVINSISVHITTTTTVALITMMITITTIATAVVVVMGEGVV